ncbi:MAG: hypothetical protein ACI4TD_08105 [Phocaeicola sp.]
MGVKEQKAKEAINDFYLCNSEKYGCEHKKDCVYCDGKKRASECKDECSADEFLAGFNSGWDACIKHLAEIPWDKAMTEIVDYAKANSKNKKDNSILEE